MLDCNIFVTFLEHCVGLCVVLGFFLAVLLNFNLCFIGLKFPWLVRLHL